MPWPSRSRKRSTASANAGCASQCALVRLDRHQGARHLVLALRAAFEAIEAVGDAPLQRLVVAGLEVQAVDALQRAPVAAVGDLGGTLPAASPPALGGSLSAIRLVAIGWPSRSATNSSQCSGMSRAMRREEVAA